MKNSRIIKLTPAQTEEGRSLHKRVVLCDAINQGIIRTFQSTPAIDFESATDDYCDACAAADDFMYAVADEYVASLDPPRKVESVYIHGSSRILQIVLVDDGSYKDSY